MAQPSMPARGDDCTAPTFDSTNPRELPRFFTDLEFHFTCCGVTDSTEKKSHATRFLRFRDQDAWESLPEFTTATTSYLEFKAAAVKLYPGTDADKKYTLADLDVLVKQPDIGPEDAYSLADLKEAADFVLQGTSIKTTSSSDFSSPSPTQIKSEPEIAVLGSTFTKTSYILLENTNTRPDGCTSCNGPHYIVNCETVTADSQTGICKRDINGRVVLPSGVFVPRHVQGRNLRERIQEWHHQIPGQVAAAQMMLDTRQNPVFMQTSNRLSIEERQACLDQENEALEKLRQAQYIQTRAQAHRVTETGGHIEEPEQPIHRVLPRPPVAPAHIPAPPPRAPAVPARAEPRIQRMPEHPYANAHDAAYAEPKGRNFGVPAPPIPATKRHDPAYRSAAPVVDNKISANIFDRSMDAPVTLSQRELLSIAPDLRNQYKEVTTSRRVATEEAQPGPVQAQFFNNLDENPRPFTTEPTAEFEETTTYPVNVATFGTFTSSMPAHIRTNRGPRTSSRCPRG
ncbi:hypothetical protein C8F04DRAFT_1280202 [Mycena alexandri]|uniref:Uncharacterized protein n=1 Tax=Mycena alexandri TaxID=1745969 RepID=A0AAD6RYM9_9AGAR|nr:hypothetical protein C8F04DRAFT_1280202 [Mycena alexandri]